MTDQIIAFQKPCDKRPRRIGVDIGLVSERGRIETELSPAEREAIKYVIADQVAIALRRNGNISAGHRTAVYAHLVSLLHREGEAGVLDFIATLAGMVGLNTRVAAE